MSLSWEKTQDELPSGPPLLTGKDVPKGKSKITIEVTAVRRAPEHFGAPIILGIKPLFEREAWAANKTNCKALAAKYGDDLEKLVGKKILLNVVLVNNPQDNKMVRSLFVDVPEED